MIDPDVILEGPPDPPDDPDDDDEPAAVVRERDSPAAIADWYVSEWSWF
jgi:hypothetical protein